MSDSTKAVFLSYASQDAEAALRIAEALRAAGVEVWFDQSELVGGDAWDQKIRRQIRDCALLIPMISKTTQARREAYFRLEWRLADERTHLMAKGTPFLLPVTIDETNDRDALVPESFLAVQWTKAPGGELPLAFSARVKAVLGIDGPEPSPRQPSPVSTLGEPSQPKKPRRRVRGLAVFAGATIAGVAAWFVVHQAKPASSPSGAVSAPALAAPDPKSVAVLPFVNLSGDPAQEYFSDGLTEEILNALARERDLRVPGRTSSFSFKGRNVPAVEIGQALHVARLVEGSVQRIGNQVRIRITLTRAADGFSEALPTFQKELTEGPTIFALQDEIARGVVGKLTQRTTNRPVAVLTKNAEAYDAYLQGRAFEVASTANGAAAIEHYERAVGLDPAFALAWAGLGTVRFRTYAAGQDRSPQVAAASRQAIDRALALQPDLPEALLARANWERHVNGDYVAARRDVARAEALQPPTSTLRMMQTWIDRDSGNWAEADCHAREALELDPRDGGNAFSLGLSLYAERGDWVEADRLAAKAEMISGPRNSQSFLRIMVRSIWRGPAAALRLFDRTPAQYPPIERARLLLQLGRIDELRIAVAAIEKEDAVPQRLGAAIRDRSPEIGLLLLSAVGRPEAARDAAEKLSVAARQEMERGSRGPTVRNALICAETTLGHREAALAALAEWRREAQGWPNVFQRMSNFHWRAAKLYAALGQADGAVALLEEYFAAGRQPPYNLRFELAFAPIRQDPRFQKRIEQQESWSRAQPDPSDP